MASFITPLVQFEVLNSIISFLTKDTYKLRLYTGVPGPKGEENLAKENGFQAVTIPQLAGEGEAAAGRKNSTAPEWVEVAGTEVYTHFGLFTDGVGPFLAWGEFTTPISVEKGDTFKINVGQLVIQAS
jgi:hypothetical protein